MYNRVLKRPMFRIGGQAGQGTGIMSHVEPRRHYDGGGGYFEDVPFGRFLSGIGEGVKTNLLKEPAAALYNIGAVPVNLASQFFTGYNPGYSGEKLFGLEGKVDPLTLSTYKPGEAKFFGFNTNAVPGYTYDKSKGIGSLTDLQRSENQARQEEQSAIEREKQRKIDENPPKVNPSKFSETDKTAPVTAADKKARIKEEASYLKELLGQEDLGKGELALIMSAAISTPGNISDKINAAVKLAMPLAKGKEKENKDVILKAYDAFREREKAEIAAGKLSETEKAVANIASAKTRTLPKSVGPNGEILYKDEDGKLKTEQQLKDEQMLAHEPISKPTLVSIQNVQRSERQIEKSVRQVQDAKTLVEQNRAAGKTKEAAAAQQQLDQAIRELDVYRKQPGFKVLYPELMNLAKGGRVKLASGSNPEDVADTTDDTTEDTDVAQLETSQMTSQDQTTPTKPVMKLSYNELRSRLPKEITNDVVQLLSMSVQALQDFAYIKTQSDVNKFNVKYGVNLVLPPVG
jgi:hypothetical protein